MAIILEDHMDACDGMFALWAGISTFHYYTVKKLSCLVLTVIGLATLTPAMCQTTPQISVKVLNCLNDGSGTSGICALSNTKTIQLEVTLDPKGNDSLKSMGETALNPKGTMPGNYIVIRSVDNQSGTNMAVRVGAYGAGEKDKTQSVYINLEIMEDASVRQNKIQTSINQAKAEDVASGKASQQLADKVTQQNAQVLQALDHYYVENRLGRFKVSAEYHSTQLGAWNGIATSSEATVDVVNKGTGFDALKAQ